LIEDEIDHERVDSNIVTPSGPSESPRANYDFMTIPIEPSNEPSEVLTMIQQVVSSAYLLLIV